MLHFLLENHIWHMLPPLPPNTTYFTLQLLRRLHQPRPWPLRPAVHVRLRLRRPRPQGGPDGRARREGDGQVLGRARGPGHVHGRGGRVPRGLNRVRNVRDVPAGNLW